MFWMTLSLSLSQSVPAPHGIAVKGVNEISDNAAIDHHQKEANFTVFEDYVMEQEAKDDEDVAELQVVVISITKGITSNELKTGSEFEYHVFSYWKPTLSNNTCRFNHIAYYVWYDLMWLDCQEKLKHEAEEVKNLEEKLQAEESAIEDLDKQKANLMEEVTQVKRSLEERVRRG